MTACRDWQSTLARASFKSVSFEVDADTRVVGRRVVTHEYPNGENWDNEDLGRAASSIQVVGYVHGDDADTRSQLLLQRCSEAGPGLLMLPARRPVQARVMSCYSTFVKDQLGRIPFEMEFVVEAKGIGGLFSAIRLGGLVTSAVAEATTSVSALFNTNFNSIMRRFSPAQFVPGLAREASSLAIIAAAEAIDGARRAVVIRRRDEETKVVRRTRQMRKRAKEFSYQGEKPNRGDDRAFVRDQLEVANDLAADLTAAIDGIASNASDPAEAGDVLDALVGFEAPEIRNGIDTLSVRAEKGLSAEVESLVRRSAVLGQAKLLTRTTYESRRDAIATRAKIAAAFDAELATLDDPETAIAMEKARNAAMTYITKSNIERPQVVTVETGVALPAIVIATSLYNDASQDAELMARNRAVHSLYMPLTLEARRP